MKSITLVCLLAAVYAADGDHNHKHDSSDSSDSESLAAQAKGKISKWTNYTITSKDKGDYWLDGRYGTHIDSEGKMNFDMVTVLHADKDLGLKPNWVYQVWNNFQAPNHSKVWELVSCAINF